MKLILYFSFLVLLAAISSGQTKHNRSALKNAQVLDEVVHQQGKDTLVIQRIEQPEFWGEASEEKSEHPTDEEQFNEEIEVVLPAETYIISATAYGPKATRLKIWSSHLGQLGALEGWSNINWAVFQGLLSLDDKNKRYQFMLFHSGSGQETKSSEIPTELPSFTQTGARYLVTSSEDTEREATLDFLESIHSLYDEKQQKLHANRELAIEQQKERQRQIKIEAAKPKTRVLKIWRHTRSEDE